ncbi:hypothetical protein FNF29_07332 [Cafeteria roenbergensis]|uniref:Uncharacterized protein n=2 Tax=Cafeteria roenbergensis TaxID=33653 RepID=A0A5A8C359_CAFRO|nr:hypothetical protein FNF29_07332 [Cafeteria roenbergensis]|eukprot:KAA0147486.1 hypothetical protein FNF29_07332 [Cafeteria roenbergensis]
MRARASESRPSDATAGHAGRDAADPAGPDAERLDQVAPWLRSQLRLLLRVRAYRAGLPRRWRRVLDSLLSRRPLEDIGLLVWILPVAALPWLKFHFFVTAASLILWGLLLGALLRGTWAAASPGRVLPSLALMPRASVHALPALDLWVGPWALTSAALTLGGGWAVAGAWVYLLLLLALRLYSMALFPHQILVSLAGGASSAMLLRWAGWRIWPGEIPPAVQLAVATLAGMGLLGVIAGYMESNIGPFGNTPRREFLRVLGNIARGPDVTVSAEEVDAAAQAVSQTLRQVRSERRRQRSSARAGTDDGEAGEGAGAGADAGDMPDIDPTALRREVAQALVDAARARQEAELAESARRAEEDIAAGRVPEGLPAQGTGKMDSWGLLIQGMRRRRDREAALLARRRGEPRPIGGPLESVSLAGGSRPPRMVREADSSGSEAGDRGGRGRGRGKGGSGFRDDGGVMGLLVEAARRAVGAGSNSDVRSGRRGHDRDSDDDGEGSTSEDEVERDWGYGSVRAHDAVTGLTRSRARDAVGVRRLMREQHVAASQAARPSNSGDAASAVEAFDHAVGGGAGGGFEPAGPDAGAWGQYQDPYAAQAYGQGFYDPAALPAGAYGPQSGAAAFEPEAQYAQGDAGDGYGAYATADQGYGGDGGYGGGGGGYAGSHSGGFAGADGYAGYAADGSHYAGYDAAGEGQNWQGGYAAGVGSFAGAPATTAGAAAAAAEAAAAAGQFPQPAWGADDMAGDEEPMPAGSWPDPISASLTPQQAVRPAGGRSSGSWGSSERLGKGVRASASPDAKFAPA